MRIKGDGVTRSAESNVADEIEEVGKLHVHQENYENLSFTILAEKLSQIEGSEPIK